ncbi:TetR/AcrR family transcriptional regulator [Cumulibacter soli]|uniref:TetR/AcrR family transcriptional regulator n=1 Tax=Cumulibacter soli TaxID=2546344 RepID=UPI001067FC5B|nr:TetR/AcrR family transcriptional regulator [Cumulibacter soli]
MNPASDDARSRRGDGYSAITNAAREIFSEHGYSGTSIRDIARKAGLSLSALYYWYPSKQALLAAIIDDADRDYRTRYDEALEDAGDDPAARLAALVRATIEFRVDRRIDSAITASELRNLDQTHHADLRALNRRATGVWKEIIESGIAAGVFTCQYPDEARRTVIAACNAVAQWYRTGGDVSREQLVERYINIAYRVVQYQPAT